MSVPVNAMLGPLDVETVALAVRPGNGSIPLDLTATFAADLSVVKAVVQDVGFTAEVTFPAVMCAEASPYRCHRRLISDWAELHGIEVVHLRDERRRERHHVTPFAHRAGDDVVYGTDGGQLPLTVDAD